jgi:hypothetical protein
METCERYLYVDRCYTKGGRTAIGGFDVAEPGEMCSPATGEGGFPGRPGRSDPVDQSMTSTQRQQSGVQREALLSSDPPYHASRVTDPVSCLILSTRTGSLAAPVGNPK